MLVFIGVQSLLATLNTRQLTRARLGGGGGTIVAGRRGPRWRDRRVAIGAGVVVVIAWRRRSSGFVRAASRGRRPGATHGGLPAQGVPPGPGGEPGQGRRGDRLRAQRRVDCVDELYAIYPDGRIIGDNGAQKAEKQSSSQEVSTLLSDIDGLGWFTDDMYSTSHTPCGQCFTYFTSVTLKGQLKTVEAVDGGTDAPANYWLVSGKLSAILPKFTAAP